MDFGKLWQDRHLIVARLRTATDDKEDDYDVLDDKSPSASSDFPQKIRMAYSFFFLSSLCYRYFDSEAIVIFTTSW